MIQFSAEELDWIIAALREYAVTNYEAARREPRDMAAVLHKQADQAGRLATRIVRERSQERDAS